MSAIPPNPQRRTDRIGARHYTAASARTKEPPYISDKEGTRWFSSGLPVEDERSLLGRLADVSWFIFFPVALALCILAVWAIGLADSGELDWLLASLIAILSLSVLAAYLVAGRRLKLI